MVCDTTDGRYGASVTCALAVDIGGTKLATGLVDGDGALLTRHAAPTPSTDDPEVVYAVLEGLVHTTLGEGAAEVCGVGSGGPMRSLNELVSPLNITAWRDFPLRRRLAESTGLPTHVDNDAKALALAEGWLGAARGRRDYVAMVVSTGVGGGIVLDGRLLDGADANAGHIGHMIAVPGGRRCPCGARGCLEAETSGTSIAAITGRPAKEADEATRVRTGELVGRVVGSVANLLDLPLALVGGSVALGFGEVFFAAAQAEIDRVCRIAHARDTRIAPVGLGDEGPLVGAAAVGFRAIGREVGVR